LVAQGFEIFLEAPAYFTIRARAPKNFVTVTRECTGGSIEKAVTADFVLARRDGTYTDGRRPDTVEIGTIFDDLARHDFTMNAIAKDMETNRIIDPFGGRSDAEEGFLKCVGNPRDRFTEDSLRALRALRFTVTHGLRMMPSVAHALTSDWLPPLLSAVSVERKREELVKAFRHDTLRTMELLHTATTHAFRRAVFVDDLWLKPSLEK
jgi:tRNA nucleotidyltransferase/poly(A) polymerase